MSRYFLRCHQDGGVEVYDADTGDANDGTTVFGPTNWATASRKAHALNGLSFLSQSPLPVCPDCRRYREAMEQIARSASERHVLRLVNEVLDA
jgi:hypothetical protein